MGVGSVAPSAQQIGPVRVVSREWGFLFIGLDVSTCAPIAALRTNVIEITVARDCRTRR